MSSAMSTPSALSRWEHKEVPLLCMPSTRMMGRRCTTFEIAVIRSRLGGSMKRDCGVSMSSFTAVGDPEGSREGWGTEQETECRKCRGLPLVAQPCGYRPQPHHHDKFPRANDFDRQSTGIAAVFYTGRGAASNRRGSGVLRHDIVLQSALRQP